jgi:hypothetical protein
MEEGLIAFQKEKQVALTNIHARILVKEAKRS